MRRLLAAALTALTLAACATTPPAPAPQPGPGPQPVPPVEPIPVPIPPAPATLELSALPGWAEDDHSAIFSAFRATCHVARAPDYAEACRRARAHGPYNRDDARRFLETEFLAERVGESGLLTAYFAPQYEARASRQGEYIAAVRPRPADLVIEPGPDGQPLIGRRAPDGMLVPYDDRATIESRPEARPLAWMRPEELFFLQIQGSGVLVLPDGRRIPALYDGTNGLTFTGIATPMRERGLLPDNNTSGDAIRQWLADHRGPEAQAIMQLNPRYGFFRTAPDDGSDPAGAAGASLPAGRAIAVDPTHHRFGELFWLDASAPRLAGAFPVYRRGVVSLDTGGAIKGQVRADLYLGKGDAAGAEAGRVRHDLRLYRLVPAPR